MAQTLQRKSYQEIVRDLPFTVDIELRGSSQITDAQAYEIDEIVKDAINWIEEEVCHVLGIENA